MRLSTTTVRSPRPLGPYRGVGESFTVRAIIQSELERAWDRLLPYMLARITARIVGQYQLKVRPDAENPAPESIREARILLGLTQTQLAARWGISQGEVGRLELGRRLPNGLRRKQIAELQEEARRLSREEEGDLAV